MFKILELKARFHWRPRSAADIPHAKTPCCAQEVSEDLQNIGIQSRRKLLMGAGCRRPEKMLAIECRLKFIVN
jgi:hypothetical protein